VVYIDLDLGAADLLSLAPGAGTDIGIGNSTGDVTVTSDNVGVVLTDNTNDVFTITEAANVYMEIDTTNIAPRIALGLVGFADALVIGPGSDGVTLTGLINADNFVALAGGGIDTQSAGDLTLGAATATSVSLGVGDTTIQSGDTAADGRVVFVSRDTIAFTNTTAKNLFTLPANADIIEITLVVTTLFNSSGTDVIDVGINGGAADAYVDNLDASATGVHRMGDAADMPFAALGDIGGSTVQIDGLFTQGVADASTGSATVIVTWTTN